MGIAVIYHHHERSRAEDFCGPLQAEGYNFVFAPLGMEVGTQKWREAVASELADADAYIVFITAKSVLDEMVAWRVEVALTRAKARGRLFLPVQLDRDMPPFEEWILPPGFHRYQRADATSVEEFLQWQHRLKAWLPASTRRFRCFVSYSRDDTNLAARLKTDLERHGIEAWVDVANIPAGAAWDDTIARAIEECSCFLLLVTPSSIVSSNVADEFGYAKEKRKLIVPLILHKAPLPFQLHRAQAIDFTKDYGAGVDLLVRELKTKVRAEDGNQRLRKP